MQNFKENQDGTPNGGNQPNNVEGAVGISADKGHVGRRVIDTSKSDLVSNNQEETQQNLMTQSELFKSYADQNYLYLNLTNNMFWFEFGGNKIGRLFLEGAEAEEFPKWRLIAKYKGEFPCHFTCVYTNGGA